MHIHLFFIHFYQSNAKYITPGFPEGCQPQRWGYHLINWTERGRKSLAAGADPGFGQGGAPASEAENWRHSEGESREQCEQSVAGVMGP